MRARAGAMAVGALLAAAAAAPAQRVGTAVVPDTVAVGDVFRVGLRVELPAGARIELPDSLPVTGDLENAGRPSVRADTLAGGTVRVTAAYPLSAWRPGELALPTLMIPHIGGAGEPADSLRAALPPVTVRSVLPADTAAVDPREAKDVVGPVWPLWLLVLAGLGLLGAAGAAGYWFYRRRGRAQPVPAGAPPHEEALALLDRARELGLADAGRFKPFYSMISGAVRHYLAAVRPTWSADLTTPELLDRITGEAEPAEADALAAILQAADLVKFADHRPGREDALGHWRAAREWITRDAERRAAAARAAAAAAEASDEEAPSEASAEPEGEARSGAASEPESEARIA